MKAKTLEKMFDEGEDVRSHLVLSKARRPGHEQRRQAKILDPQQTHPQCDDTQRQIAEPLVEQGLDRSNSRHGSASLGHSVERSCSFIDKRF